MPSNLTADDFKAVEDHLRKEYFLVRSQTLVLAVAMLAALGAGTIATAYAAAKAAAAAEAEKVAKAVVADTTAKVATDEIIKLKNESEQHRRDVASLSVEAEQKVSQIRKNWEDSGQLKSLDGRVTTEVSRLEKLLAAVKGQRIEVLETWYGNTTGDDAGWRTRYGERWQEEKVRWEKFTEEPGMYKSAFIRFKKPFQEVPVVFLSFGRNEQAGQMIPVSMGLSAEDVTSEGFCIRVEKPHKAKLGNCGVNILVLGK